MEEINFQIIPRKNIIFIKYFIKYQPLGYPKGFKLFKLNY